MGTSEAEETGNDGCGGAVSVPSLQAAAPGRRFPLTDQRRHSINSVSSTASVSVSGFVCFRQDFSFIEYFLEEEEHAI